MSRGQILSIILIFLGIGIVSFFIGRITAPHPIDSSLEESSDILFISATDIIEEKDSQGTAEPIRIRASSRGSKYYFPWCTSTFSEANTVYFESEEEAHRAGYERASGCLEMAP